MCQIHDGGDLGVTDVMEQVEGMDGHIDGDIGAGPPLDQGSKEDLGTNPLAV